MNDTVLFGLLVITYTIIMIFVMDYFRTSKEKRKVIKRVNAKDFEELMVRGQIIDVRKKEDYKASKHILGSRNVPIDVLGRSTSSLMKDQVQYVYGKNKKQAIKASNVLYKAGFSGIVILADSLDNFEGKMK